MIFALHSQRLLEEYISLISMLYQNQRTSVNRNSEFPVERGVKQGYIFNVILFNCVVDIVFDE